MNDHDGGSRTGISGGQDDIDRAMTAFKAALARMDSNPAEAARIRAIANLTDERLAAEGNLRPRRDAGAPASPAAEFRELLSALGVQVSAGSLRHALTHRSYAYENGNLPTNERLEFLGDAVLELVVTDTLFRGYPHLPEGQLAKLRAAVVQTGALADVARDLNLGAYLRLGHGEEGTGGRDKASILADSLEAVIGEIYLNLGMEEASALVHRLFDPVIKRSASLGAGLDWKTSLQELTAVQMLGAPEYVVEESGPDHHKFFSAVVKIAGRTLGSGRGRTKKAAEQQAAQAAWAEITDDKTSSHNVRPA
jgi:ribonuclease III